MDDSIDGPFVYLKVAELLPATNLKISSPYFFIVPAVLKEAVPATINNIEDELKKVLERACLYTGLLKCLWILFCRANYNTYYIIDFR